MVARLGHVLYWLFSTAAGLWMMLVLYAWERMTFAQNLFGLSLVAVLWLIGWVFRYILSGIDSILLC
jgi:hypothetical protein